MVDQLVALGHGCCLESQAASFLTEPVLLAELTDLRFQFRGSQADSETFRQPCSVAFFVLCNPAAYFSTPQDRMRRPPPQSYGPLRETSHATRPSNSSEYFTADMVSILSTQGKRTPSVRETPPIPN